MQLRQSKRFCGEKEVVLQEASGRPLQRCDTAYCRFYLQVTILARESGLRLELDDIPIQSLVPKPLEVGARFS
jgi:hypothetical protein